VRSGSLSYSPVSTEIAVAQLLRMLAALEETIIRLEQEDGPGETIRRLRVIQGEILGALQLLRGDFPISG
jgi:hypothetical protein